MIFRKVLMSSAAAAALTIAAPLAHAADPVSGAMVKVHTDIVLASGYLLSANELIGQDVVNAKGETIARIDDVLVTKDDKAVVAVLSVGGFLGINDKLVAVPYDRLTMTEKGVVAEGYDEKKLEQMAAVEYRDGESFGLSRHRYEARMNRTMDEWSDKIAHASDTSAEKAKDGAHTVSRETEEAWEKTKEKFRELKAASGEAWEETRTAFEDALDDLNKRWDRATN